MIILNKKEIKLEHTAKFLGVIFDSRLKWKPHIDYIVTKCKKRINIMRAVSGYQWGASKRAMLYIYRSLIRSILDYGDVAFITASNSQLKKLQNIQSEALRLACVAAKGTPLLALQNECGDMPLHFRRLGNSLKVGSKILGNKDHPAAETMIDHWSNYYHIANNNKTNSIFERTEEFFSSIPSSFQSPVFSQTAPWKNKHNIKVDVSITKQINKQIDSQDFMRSLSLELITRYNDYTLGVCGYTRTRGFTRTRPVPAGRVRIG